MAWEEEVWPGKGYEEVSRGEMAVVPIALIVGFPRASAWLLQEQEAGLVGPLA